MVSEPYCRSMLDRPSDEDVSRQILGVFMRHRIPATGMLQRNYFFEVRDSDFQRGINKAVANNWVTIDLRNRYRYQLTTTGYAVGRMIHPVLGAQNGADVRFGSKADICTAPAYVCFTPDSDHESGSRERSCLLYPQKRPCAAYALMSA